MGLWKPLRDFLYVDDLARAIIILMEKYNNKEIINIGSGKEIIKDLAEKIKAKFNYKGKIYFDKSFPDGTPRKILDISRIKKYKWLPKIKLDKGLDLTITSYKKIY